MRFVAYVLGGLLLLLSLAAIFTGNIKAFNFFLLAVSLLLLFLGYKSGKNDTRFGDPLELWLKKNRTQVLESGGTYNGHSITKDTQIIRYLFVFSFILFTSRVPSRWYVKGKDNTALAVAAYTLGSAVAGWWGVPWGPVYTVQALYRNLRGGYRVSVADFLGHQSAANV
jgi:Ca2+/Na+ antiporter